MLLPFVYVLASIIVGQSVIESAKILVHLPTTGRSHFKPFEPLFVELARRGHNVTVVGAFPPEQENENYRHLQVRSDINIKSRPMADLRRQYRLENYVYLHDIVQDFAVLMVNETHTRNLLQSGEKFDLIMVELYHFDTFFALAGPSNAPIIGLSFQPLQPVYHWVLKNPWTFSYIPHLYLPHTDRMNFMERLVNTVFGTFTVLFYNLVSLAKYQDQSDLLFEEVGIRNAPKIEQVTENLSLIFVESHFSAGYPQPYLPNVVEVGGIHIPPKKKLPEDVENFINNSTNGVVYVSFGTLIDPDSLDDLGTKFIQILEKLPYNVLWKWNPKLLSKIPQNVLVREWLPQADILRHPKCKLFVSHGGYHSIVETINAGVPILCLPFFTDQYYNAAIIEHYAIGKKANMELSGEELFSIISELLIDERYQENAKSQSIIFKDRPLSSLDAAVYWTEYVIRHKGAPHLKSAARELYWYQYLLLDVISFILVIVSLLFYVVKKCIQFFVTKIFNSLAGSKNKIT